MADDAPRRRNARWRESYDGRVVKSITGELVRGQGEAAIADYLTLHAIPYSYEDRYPCAADYHPDFHILDGDTDPYNDVYIEFWGIGEDGMMFDGNPLKSLEYRESMEWKRNLHKRYGTDLIELRYRRSPLWRAELQAELGDKLADSGVRDGPRYQRRAASTLYTMPGRHARVKRKRGWASVLGLRD